MVLQDKSAACFLSVRENDACDDVPLELGKAAIERQQYLSREWSMEIGRVVGTVVSTIKSDGLTSYKLLIVTPLSATKELTAAEGRDDYVAIDLAGSGEGEIVLVTRGSAARVSGATDVPTDAAIIAVVDTIQIGTRNAYSKP
jgi:microcompartment protein CcmK/EutM